MLEKLYGLVRKTVNMVQGECPLHHVPLVRGPAPIVYGLVTLSNEYRAARNNLFPTAVSFLNGGCRFDSRSPHTRYVHYCEQCRSAERQWKEANPDDPLMALEEKFNIAHIDPSQRASSQDLQRMLHNLDASTQPDSSSNPDASSNSEASSNPDLHSGKSN